MLNKLINNFNSSDTIAIISPFYTKSEGDFRGHSIARYTNLLINSFSKDQKVVVFCEKKKVQETPYQASETILVFPTYKFNSLNIFGQMLTEVNKFNHTKDYLIQFEFSIFGGKKVIPSILLSLLSLRLLGKNVSITLHQVATNLNDLSGHLGLQRNSFKIHFLNVSLNLFYRTIGVLSNKIIVHDEMLKSRLSEFVNPEKILIIPHAVGDTQRKSLNVHSKTSARKSFGLGIKDKVIGVYGYRSWYKGTDWIVSTARQLALRYPGKNIKLLVAGGVSPTLKDTGSYKNFDRRIKRVIKNADGSVVVTGFIKEKDVWKVFSASDVMVFPYRTRMSASGAFSLTLAYEKPFLVSRPFAKGMKIDEGKLIFDLNTFSFEQRFLEMIGNKKLNLKSVQISRNLAKDNSWASVASLYLNYCLSGKIFVGNTNAIEKAFQLA